ncbi:peptidase S15 [Mycobacterium sp. Y57]|uniref:CocE/NonD family hydrolase n=1 Tax=Mycolicibacterium xanthum TaxID=2796469 RepID=UPI001C862ABA|nr:CocE/NonD family hydrolase [Mycolicibacterium xanthum]MBX7435194.1 peptidase S15 [Mycolicibacterium xanthum]
MGAARCIGRVGGLAVALGVGTAIVTGQGVAYADDTDTSKPTTTSSESPKPDADVDSGAADERRLGGYGATSGTSLIRDAVQRTVDRITQKYGDHTADTDHGLDDEDATIDDDASDEDTQVNDEVSGDEASAQEETSNGSGARRHRDDVEVDAMSDAAPSPGEPVADTVAEDAPAEESSGLESQSEPLVSDDGGITMTALWTPPPTEVTEIVDAAVPTTTATPETTELSGLLMFADSALNPFSTNGGTAPVGGSITDLLLLAGTRRELIQPQAADLPASSVGLTEGVIEGCVVGMTCTTADGSTYTVISDPSKGGKLTVDATTGAFRFLPYAEETSVDGPSGQEAFSVLVAQNTEFTTFVIGLPIVGSTIIAPVIMTLQQLNILAPLIGTASRQDILVDVDALRGPSDTPIAYTTMVTSWDGVKISTNFFPAITTGNPDDANPGYETIFYGPGLASAGATDPANPFVSMFREAGYNVVTWDPRGEFASGGVLQLDSPQYEGQDVSQLISWAAGLDGVELDAPNDPNMGMVGVSYGGGIQLVTAAGDSRVDAIAPGWSWNNLPDSFYPDEAFRTSYAGILLLGLVTTGARINPQIYPAMITGATLGILTPGQIQLLQNSGPGQTVRGIDAPTLLIQGTVDVLFPLQQSILNTGYLALNDDVKLLWYCGGHGTCLPGQGNPSADNAWIMGETLAWMNRYVKDDGSTDDVAFAWTDQNGDRWTSELRPTDDGFYQATSSIPTTTWDDGGLLPIIPLIGGSGPSQGVPFPYSLGNGSIATNAVTIPLENPAAEATVVGAPHVVIEYSGLGTSRHIYAQVVDKSTGLVVGNIVTPVPVTLNGQTHTATIDLSDISYTVEPDSELELQIFTTATPFLNLTQFGFVNIQSVEVTLPTTTQGTNQGPNPDPVANVLVAV